jgi:hypothetical protein
MAALRVDLVFSYWVYVWYILYELDVIKYSPKFALTLGLIDNIIMLFLMMYFGSKGKTILLFILINTLIKGIPLYYLYSERIKINDILFTCVLFLIFGIWLHINEQSLIGNIKLVHDSLLYNKSQTPFINLIDKIEKNFKYIQII